MASSPVQSLRAELARIAGSTRATVGIAVKTLRNLALPDPFKVPRVDLELVAPEDSAREPFEGRFPMASTFKIPLALSVLQMVDAGRISLEQKIVLDAFDVRPGTGVLTAGLLAQLKDVPRDQIRTECSLYELLEKALNDSDNTATDVLLDRVGGPSVVFEPMKESGLDDIRVTRSCLEHLCDRCGIRCRIPTRSSHVSEMDMVDFVALLEGRMEIQPLSVCCQPDREFDADPRDTTTPEAMAGLLEKIWNREAGTQVLLEIMGHCRTGAKRILGRMPRYGAGPPRVQHKTGSLGGRANDVGIVYLPNGHAFAICCYTKGLADFVAQSTTGDLYEDRERLIADVARACYDFHLFACC